MKNGFRANKKSRVYELCRVRLLVIPAFGPYEKEQKANVSTTPLPCHSIIEPLQVPDTSSQGTKNLSLQPFPTNKTQECWVGWNTVSYLICYDGNK